MNLLFYTSLYDPSIGGQEAFAAVLAHELSTRGMRVHLVTETPGATNTKPGFEVTRRPPLLKALRNAAASDCGLVVGGAIRGLLPLATTFRPTLVSHQTWLPSGEEPAMEGVRRYLLTRCSNVAVSRAVAESIPVPCRIIPNPYDADTFHSDTADRRPRDLLFVGRLVSDKGADLLLRSLQDLRANGLKPSVSIVGDGPELQSLKKLTAESDLTDQVSFLGPLRGVELAEIYRRHKILVVPSKWDEPFGIVALEGIACGCTVIGSSGGGLSEAIGPGGLTFPNSDVQALTSLLREVLDNPAMCDHLRSNTTAHLTRHSPSYIAKQYLDELRSLGPKPPPAART